MSASDELFLKASSNYLREVYLPRIRRALEILPEADLWWRPHPETPGVGHLLLHLAGNVRQWIVSGLGAAPDHRVRAREFDPDSRPEVGELMDSLAATVDEACEVLASLRGTDLGAACKIQGFDNNVLEAVYHVVEHFSWHTGQIVTVAKHRSGPAHGLAFYDESKINNSHNS